MSVAIPSGIYGTGRIAHEQQDTKCDIFKESYILTLSLYVFKPRYFPQRTCALHCLLWFLYSAMLRLCSVCLRDLAKVHFLLVTGETSRIY